MAEYIANFEFNRNTLEFEGEVSQNKLQANLIVDYRPSKTSQLINDSGYITINDVPTKVSELVNDTGFITTSELIPLENDIVEIENDILSLQNNKVDKVTGKGLSTNDFTNAFKTKLEGIEAGAEVNKVNSVNGQIGDVVIEIPDSATWGNITGTLSNQTDLQQALNSKQAQLTQTQLNAVNSGANTTNIGQIATNTSDISDINSLIPNQASISNQLADKDFVNSSISTNTANFIGTFNSVAELEAYSGMLTNNDYAFVRTADIAGNTLYDRFKWNGTEWLFEYELNNSSFTAQQWAAINSNITASETAQIATNADNIADLQNAGFITGIDSSDVINALGYTPYNSLNPSNYTSVYESTVSDWGFTKNTGTVTSVNNIQPVNGNVTLPSSEYNAGTGLQLSGQNEFNILQEDINGLPYKDISNNITIVGDIYSFPYVGSSGNANTKIELYPPLSITSNDTVEIQFLYKVASAGNRCLLNAYNSTDTTFSCLRLFVGRGNRHNSRTIDFDLNGTSSKITPTAAQLNNKDYFNNWWYIRIILEPNAQTVDISDDGTNWNNLISKTSSAVYNKTFDNIIIGNETVLSQYPETFYGDIDFSKSFIKINDNIWWSGKGDVSKSVAKATDLLYGLIKPDNSSITVNDGVISSHITSSDITTALGYTPYNSTNPARYITQAVDDTSTTSTTFGWSASKLNGIIGDIETAINTIRGV